MDRKRLKFLALGSAIFGVMALLIVYGMATQPGGMVYYLTVSEYLALREVPPHGSRVNGKVEVGTIRREPLGQAVSFVMSDGARSLPVSYTGIIPDTFVDEAAVVVEGSRGDDGTFVAHTLLAKCPSKYEAADDFSAAPGDM